METQSNVMGKYRKFEAVVEIAMLIIIFTASAYGIASINHIPVFPFA
jgi:hypothetical protein